MKPFKYPAIGLILMALATPAAAQQLGTVHSFARPFAGEIHEHVLNPNLSLTSPATSPLQSQVQDDYATQLRAEQRGLMLQNPAGTTRDQLEVGHELNGFSPR